MNSVKHEPFEKTLSDTGETPNEIPPIMPVIKTYKNLIIVK